MDKIDKLLAQLDQKGGVVPEPAQSGSSSTPPSSTNRLSIDHLLGEIAEDTKRSVRTELSQRAEQGHPPERSPSYSPLLNAATPQPDPLLTQLKSQYSEQDRMAAERQEQAQREAEQQRQREEREKQRRLEALRMQRRAELTQVAQQWLKQLKPRSEEGRWFEEFACNYESRLEAAIDYLEALEEVDRKI